MHNILNTNKVTEFSVTEDGMAASDVHATIQKFFGLLIESPTTLDAQETDFGIYYSPYDDMYYWDSSFTDSLAIDAVTNVDTIQKDADGAYVIEATIYDVPPSDICDAVYIDASGYPENTKLTARIEPSGNFYVLRYYEIMG